MPELPEVESARAVIERTALGRRITDVDDTDSYVCRPHGPGALRAALIGRRLTAVHRQGKSMWCDTSGLGRSRRPGPALGIHLGMSGRVVFGDGRGPEVDGGDYWRRGRAAGDHRFARFRLGFSGGAFLMLVDPRRLARVRLDPPVETLGPDARELTQSQFHVLVARGTAPLKARLLDQDTIAGVGNLLADHALWDAKLDPRRPAGQLTRTETDRLFRRLRVAIDAAIAGGGVHTLRVVGSRRAGGICPRCGTPMQVGTVGGRTTWWCPTDQV